MSAGVAHIERHGSCLSLLASGAGALRHKLTLTNTCASADHPSSAAAAAGAIGSWDSLYRPW